LAAIAGRGRIREDYADLVADQLGSQHWQAIILAVGKAVLERYVLPLDKAGLF